MTMRLSLLLVVATISSITATIGASWPSSPVDQTPHARLLGAGASGPSGNDIATYNIILFSSIGMVAAFYFATMALVNMDVGNDSMLYSKAKAD
mmetsp:Transcript_40238/g.106554  ORF Transcript_40238/g.106554 Transcript_40238/m.106554 type:complete len:94 (+) Transcript_40238:17-298(+)